MPSYEVVLALNDRNEWELPGGRIEIDESSTACLAREFKEELGIDVEAVNLIDTYLFEVIPDKHVFIATYSCRLIGEFNPVVSHEHRKIATFPIDDLPTNLPRGYVRSIRCSQACTNGAAAPLA
ncbi:NUDIX domain-containing protein [Halomonas sp. SpR1]|uniref:NUDIX hydrolase n=1 Tax=Halomonas sp. SpR1 TaxID=3050462 RepID=UPI0027E4E87B|nr:NUDIX domain-containing protein [Halomonas sp. SpR1]MDQ7734453.1 NUDIX domain-containing protein [Halomonas sp. SpR1]